MATALLPVAFTLRTFTPMSRPSARLVEAVLTAPFVAMYRKFPFSERKPAIGLITPASVCHDEGEKFGVVKVAPTVLLQPPSAARQDVSHASGSEVVRVDRADERLGGPYR